MFRLPVPSGVLAFAALWALPVSAQTQEFHSISRFVADNPALATPTLRKGKPQAGTVEGPAVRRFALDLKKGDFAAVRLDQTGGDLILTVFAPDGKLLDIIDQNTASETETGILTAAQSGRYIVQVAQYDWRAGATAFTIALARHERTARSAVARANQLMESWYDPRHPGAAIVVLKDGKLVYERMIGLANVENAVPISDRTRFELASVSKQFTGFAIAMLIDRGVLSRDDAIRRWLPELPDWAGKVTIGQLLDHTSGLRDWDAGLALAGLPVERGMTVGNVIDFAARQNDGNFAPGSEQLYSNTGYVLLGEIIGRATGVAADVWMAANIFAPLGMDSTRLNLDAGAVIPDKAQSYEGRVPAVRLSSGGSTAVGGSTSVSSTLGDLIRWVGNLQSGRVGGPAVMEMLSKPATLPDGRSTGYTFGLWHKPHRGLASIGHLGLAAGFRTRITRFPDQNAAIIFLSNDGDDAGYARSERIEEIFLPVAPTPAIEVPTDSPPEPAPPLPPVQLADYAGTYWSDAAATGYVVELQGDVLRIRHAINTGATLTRIAADRFSTGRWFMPELIFHRDAGGTVTDFATGTDGARNIVFRRIR